MTKILYFPALAFVLAACSPGAETAKEQLDGSEPALEPVTSETSTPPLSRYLYVWAQDAGHDEIMGSE